MQTSSNVGIEREENHDEDIYPPFEESKGQSELVSNDGSCSMCTAVYFKIYVWAKFTNYFRRRSTIECIDENVL